MRSESQIGNSKRLVIDPKTLTRQFKEGLLTSLKPFSNNIKAIQRRAEQLYFAHQNIELEDKYFYHRRINFDLPVRTIISFSFQTKINLNESFMQVPTDLYDQNKLLVNQVIWSKPLDDLFKEQYNSDPQFSWQYVGFTTGATRQFPGSHLVKE